MTVKAEKHLDDLQQALAGVIRRAGGYRWVGLYEVSEADIAVVAWEGPAPPTHPRFPRTQGLNGAAVASGSRVIVQDVRTDPRYLTTIGGTRAEMIVPVKDEDGRVVGTIDVECEQANAFSDSDRALLEGCAEALRPLWS
jgi:L-methionine (R)-S-oxide reductase